MIIKVAVDSAPLYKFDYLSSDENIRLFQRVIVPIRNKKVIGFVIEKNVKVDYDFSKIKYITKILDDNKVLISDFYQNIIKWTSKYYLINMCNVLKLALPKEFFTTEKIDIKKVSYLYLNNEFSKIDNLNSLQKEIINLIKNQTLEKKFLQETFSVSRINTLIKKNILKEKFLSYIPKNNINNKDEKKELTSEQQLALNEITKSNGFKTFLLYGVTGSGKTEIYLQTIDFYIQQKKQILILIPEINLTPQTVQRFSNRFPDKNIVSIHSKISLKDKLTNYHNIKNGEINIVIATRSGILTEFYDLGLIIIDEEHDKSFKEQTISFRYNAKDLAIVIASLKKIPIILGSATPSIKSFYNTKINRYKLLKLTERPTKYEPPKIKIIDLKNTNNKNGISHILLKEIENNVNDYNQSLVFINKLGYAKALVCKNCSEVVECKNCDKPYTLHNYPTKYLKCHFCDTSKQIITECSKCNSKELFEYGTGTEKVQIYLEDKFAYNQVLRFDRQNINNITKLNDAINNISKKNVDIIVGTQMIAKGHHFENISLVGLVNIDSGFYSLDFNAIENTAQLIIQVAGRAGRGNISGTVLLQTYQPHNPILLKLINSDYLEFLKYLLKDREIYNLPPYSNQAMIIGQSKNYQQCLDVLLHIYSKLKDINNIKISKPIPATHIKKNNIYKYSLIITALTKKEIHKILNYVKHLIDNTDIKKANIKIIIDIDPIEF